MNRARLVSLMLAAALAVSSLVSAQQAAVKSPEVGADRRVTFRLRAPAAKEVAVSMGGKRLPMNKDDSGLWSVTSDRRVAARLWHIEGSQRRAHSREHHGLHEDPAR